MRSFLCETNVNSFEDQTNKSCFNVLATLRTILTPSVSTVPWHYCLQKYSKNILCKAESILASLSLNIFTDNILIEECIS